MRFIVDLDVAPDDDRGPITAEQMREHLQTYEFGPDVSFEMSLVPDDPDHEKGRAPEDYRTFTIPRAHVEIVDG